MKRRFRTFILALFMLVMIFPLNAAAKPQETKTGNPYLPLWEHIPDGEPHVFSSPDSAEQRLYIYGSHDSGSTAAYCGRDYVTWSASTNDLSDWKCEGEIFNASAFDGLNYTDASGAVKSLSRNSGRMLFAPDVLYYPETETYYLFMSPNPDNKIFAASSKSPCGPFTSPQYICDGFDPAVLVDDTTDVNGHRKVYLYYSTESGRDCFACQLDPFNYMKIVKGTLHYPDTYSKNSDHSIAEKATMISKSLEPFYFFEGPSIRKVHDWYILSYQRSEPNGSQNGKLAEIGWAYCKNPFGDPNDSSAPDIWHYGGVIVSNLGQTVKDPYSQKTINTFYGQNNHGGMVEMNGKWYQIYHRATGNGLKRQSMAEEISFSFNDDGTPSIKQAEMTSQGFSSEGLFPFCDYYAAIACYEIGGTASSGQWMMQSSSYPVFNCTSDGNYSSSGSHGEWYPVQDLRHHCWLGYKYFNFESGISDDNSVEISLSIKEYAAGKINIYSSDAREYEDGQELSKTLIGTISLSGTDKTEHIVNAVLSPETLTGKKAIYLEFISNQNSSSSKLCDLNKIGFSAIPKLPESHEHSYQATITAPTCTEQGYTTHTCSCGDSYKDSYTNPLNHDYGAWTKLNDTQHQRVCKNDNSHVETANHAWDNGKVTTSAACTTDGAKTYTCSVCNDTKTEVIPATGHNYGTWQVTKAATCTEDGIETRTCTHEGCRETETRTIKAIGHSFTDYRSNGDATCTQDGTKTAKCDRCDATNTVTDTGSKLRHTEKAKTTKATLTKNGKITYTCATCGETTKKAKTIYAVDSVKLSSTSYTYNGEAKKPTVTVKDSQGNTLKKGTDYTVTYASGRKNVGSYKVTVKGTGKYSFTKTLTFKINPAKAKLTSVTSKSAGTMLVKWNKVSGVTGYQIKYTVGDTTKTVKVTKAATVSKTIKSLKKGKRYTVSIRSYKTVNDTTYYSAYSSTKDVTVAK